MSTVPPELLRSKLEASLKSVKHIVRPHPFLPYRDPPSDSLSINIILLQEILDSSSGCGKSYSIVVVADDFEGLNTLKRNRLSEHPPHS